MSNLPMTVLLGLLALAWAGLTAYTIGHILLRKTYPNSAWGWIVATLLLPFAGAAIYALFGINRVQRRAQRQRRPHAPAAMSAGLAAQRNEQRELAIPSGFGEVARTGDAITRLPLLGHNQLSMLHNGEQAYPAMLTAIDEARVSIAVLYYIFAPDALGQRFIDALVRAHERGVQIRCVLDGIGELAWNRSGSQLRAHGIPVARFNPLRLWPPFLHANLRNHRKLLVIDRQLAFAGGMNLSRDHLADDPEARHPTADLQIVVRGPVIEQLLQVFLEDWHYAHGEAWQMPPPPDGDIARPAAEAGQQSDVGSICRVIRDGPDERFPHLVLVLLAAIGAAQREVLLITPYFLPPEELLVALQSAALRGVAVHVILSSDSDHPMAHWATQKLLVRLLDCGVHIAYQPPPFCHTKLTVIDGTYAQFGSANLDARSLRLNFEMMVEVYDAGPANGFSAKLATHARTVLQRAQALDASELRRRPLAARLRNAACWLFSPYL